MVQLFGGRFAVFSYKALAALAHNEKRPLHQNINNDYKKGRLQQLAVVGVLMAQDVYDAVNFDCYPKRQPISLVGCRARYVWRDYHKRCHRFIGHDFARLGEGLGSAASTVFRLTASRVDFHVLLQV